MSTRRIKDPVHGYIELDEPLVERLVDTPEFQRLRRVRQLSATHLVYPGATHTRFEHSLGVYHLASEVFSNLRGQSYFTDGATTAELDEIEQTLSCASLLHDIGHPPLSHLGERHLDVDALRKRLAETDFVDRFRAVAPDVNGWPKPIERAAPHELLSCIHILEVYDDALETLGVSPAEVAGYVLGWSLAYETGAAWQYGVGPEVLHSPVDVDRLDYMVRDDHMTGADVLDIDTDRMTSAYTAHPKAGLALAEGALSAIGNYLEGRVSLYQWVTQHHKSVYANMLFQRLLDELAAREDLITADAVLAGVDDFWLLERFREAAVDPPSEAFGDLYDRYRSRDFAESCWKHRLGFGDAVPDGVDPDAYARWLIDNDDSLEATLADDLDLPDHEVWVEHSYVPEYEPGELRDIPLAHRGRVQSVADHGLYGGREFERTIPFVYVPEGYARDAVAALATRYPRQ